MLTLSVALDGENFGVDFNPAANALRVVSDTGQNLRRPFETAGAATVADTTLTNPAVAPATGTVPALGVTGAAYTNNDATVGTATTLFDVDTSVDGDTAVDNQAFATLDVDGDRGLYSINLRTGRASHLGGLDGVTDIALPLAQD